MVSKQWGIGATKDDGYVTQALNISYSDTNYLIVGVPRLNVSNTDIGTNTTFSFAAAPIDNANFALSTATENGWNYNGTFWFTLGK